MKLIFVCIALACVLGGCMNPMSQGDRRAASDHDLHREIALYSSSLFNNPRAVVASRDELLARPEARTWSEEARNMVARGEVSQGMSAGMVLTAWGTPSQQRSSKSPYGRIDDWEWGAIGTPSYKGVSFRDGIVSWWHVGE